MESRESKRIELLLPIRTVLIVAAAVGLIAAFIAIGSTFLIIFVGIFLALVFEYPVRLVMAKTGMSRGLAATVTVLGAAVAILGIGLLFLAPMVGGVRDFLQDLPATVEQLRSSDELSGIDSGGAGENVQSGAEKVAASVPDAISKVLGIAGSFFSIFLAAFTILFICIFLLSDIANMKRSLASVLMPGEDERWLAIWERVTTAVSRWAIGVAVIAVIAGTTLGVTAWLLGSSYALALGVIAGLLDMIPNLGATISGFILVPALWAEEGLTAAIIMLVVLLVYQQIENNVLTPKIQGKAVNLSGFFIIVAVTLFGALLGVLGALTAVPLAAAIQIFVQELTKARALEAQRHDAEGEREPHAGHLTDDAEGGEHERGHRSHSRERHRELVPRHLQCLGDVQAPPALEALGQPVRVHVRDPEHDHGDADDRGQLPRARAAVSPGRDRRHHHDRPVDRPADAPPAPEQNPPERAQRRHGRRVRGRGRRPSAAADGRRPEAALQCAACR